MQTHLDVWYEIQWSTIGEDDWYSANTSADTIESARVKLAEHVEPKPGRAPLTTIEFRIVKVTRTEETLNA